MTDYATAATTARDTAFLDRVRAALLAACARVGSGNFVDASQKAYFVGMLHSIVGDPDHYVTVYAWVLAAYCGLGVDCSDADLDTAIDALWPAVSGYISAQA